MRIQLGQGDTNNSTVPIVVPTSVSDRSSRNLGVSSSSDSGPDGTQLIYIQSHQIANSKAAIVYGQELLESTLSSQYKHYRPGIILQRCLEFENFTAAAVVSFESFLNGITVI